MPIEVQEGQGLLTTVKKQAARYFPSWYAQARLLKEGLADCWKFPYAIDKSVGGVDFRMVIGNRSEQREIDGPYYEEEELKTILGCIRPGDVIYDVGASTGSYTVPTAIKTGEYGQVYAFEPEPDRARALEENIIYNRLTNVRVLQKALWDHDTQLVIHTSGRAGQAPQVRKIGQPPIWSAYVKKLPVEAQSMDSFIQTQAIKPPDILKIDVEGATSKVLQGLGAARPRHIFVEIHPRLGERVDEIAQLLNQRDYQLVSQVSRRLEMLCHFVSRPEA